MSQEFRRRFDIFLPAFRPYSVAAAAALTLLLWASVYSAVKVGLEGFSPWELAFARLFVASAALAIFAVVKGARLPDRRHLPGLILIGFIGFALYLVLLNTGQQSVEAGTASFIISATPALAVLFSVLFLKETLRPVGYAGILISFCGVALIVFSKSHGLALEMSFGALILIFAAIAHASHFVFQKALLKDVSPFQVTLVSIWAGTAFLSPFAPETVAALFDAPRGAVIAAIYLGVLPSALAYATWAYVIANSPSTLASSLLALISPLAVAIGAIWLHELPTWLAFVGGVLAITGVLIIQGAGRTSPSETTTPKEECEG